MERQRIAPALDADHCLQRDRRDVRRAGEEQSRDHRDTQIGRATPRTLAAGTGPKYRLSKPRGWWLDRSQICPGGTE